MGKADVNEKGGRIMDNEDQGKIEEREDEKTGEEGENLSQEQLDEVSAGTVTTMKTPGVY